jgi:hypothetical protein
MLWGLVKRIIVQKSKKARQGTENTFFLMNLMWKVANSEEFGSRYLRQFTTKLRLYSD